MKKLLITLAILLIPASTLFAANANDATQAYAFEQITVSSSAIGLTSSNIVTTSGTGQNTLRVVCAVETNNIRFRTDGTAPTASVGYPVSSGSQIELNGPLDISNFKAIRQTSDATLSCIYWR